MKPTLETWCKKNSHLLIFSGALIVFLTFIIKEGLGEHWRETAGKIDMAQYVYGIRHDTSTPESRNSTIRSIVADYRAEFKEQHLPDVYQAMLLKLERKDRLLGEVGQTIMNIRIVAETLPDSDEYAKEIAELDSRAMQTGFAIFRTFSVLPGEKPGTTKPPSHEDFVEAVKEQGVAVDQIASKVDDLSLRETALVTRILKDAQSIRQTHDSYAKGAWWISALLFAIGWGLGLLGKLYGVQEAASG
ncbi:MAG: hypothetical protein ABSE28_20855 [Candidatus Sulfotelmatobacter sp.]|jgi:hypothetical protein